MIPGVFLLKFLAQQIALILSFLAQELSEFLENKISKTLKFLRTRFYFVLRKMQAQLCYLMYLTHTPPSPLLFPSSLPLHLLLQTHSKWCGW